MPGVLIKGELGHRDLGHGATAREGEDRHGVALVQAKEHEDTSDPRAGSPGPDGPSASERTPAPSARGLPASRLTNRPVV